MLICINKAKTYIYLFQERLSAKTGLPVREIRLFAVGEPLVDALFVGHLGTTELDLNVGLAGGKVHGSLARAGKVKGQTPKVEKVEKKKKKTGRAKRRFQYNRRFVNIVQSFGRKRGPNAAPIT
jgi:small subunit ribosomal protein S30e